MVITTKMNENTFFFEKKIDTFVQGNQATTQGLCNKYAMAIAMVA